MCKWSKGDESRGKGEDRENHDSLECFCHTTESYQLLPHGNTLPSELSKEAGNSDFFQLTDWVKQI